MRGQNFTCWWGCRTRGLGRVPCAESTEMSMGTFQGSLWGNLGPERRPSTLFTHCHLKNGNQFSAKVRTMLTWPSQTQLWTVGGCNVWRAPGFKPTLYLSHILFLHRACETANVAASNPRVTEHKDTVLLAATQLWAPLRVLQQWEPVDLEEDEAVLCLQNLHHGPCQEKGCGNCQCDGTNPRVSWKWAPQTGPKI